MESTAWQTMSGWMGKIHEAMSAYDKADSEYANVCSFTRKSRPLGDSMATQSSIAAATVTTNQHHADFALRWERLEAARKVVEVTCEGYISSIHRSFEKCKREYETLCISYTSMNAETDENKRTTTDMSLFHEQRKVMNKNADFHFENAIKKHRTRLTREKANHCMEIEYASHSSAKVVDAIDNMKMTINVDWWMFLQEMDRLIQNQSNTYTIRIENHKNDDGDYNDIVSTGFVTRKGNEKYADQLNAFFDAIDLEVFDGDDNMDSHDEAVRMHDDIDTESVTTEEWNMRVEAAELDSVYNWYRMHNDVLTPMY